MLWKSDLTLQGTVELAYTGTPTSPQYLRLVMPDTHDNVLTPMDATPYETGVQNLNISASADKQHLIFSSPELTALVRQLLADGETTLTLRLETSSPFIVDLDAPDAASAGTGLEVTWRHGVKADLYDANGGLLESGFEALDMRNMAAASTGRARRS